MNNKINILHLLRRFLTGKNEFLPGRPVALLQFFVFLSACTTPVIKVQNGCETLDGIPPVQDIHFEKGEKKDKKGRLIMAVQNRGVIDSRDEYMSQGAIFFMYVAGSYESEFHQFNLKNRDEYPFHPVRIHSLRSGRNSYLIVINRALRDVYALEVYSMTNADLTFLYRVKGNEFRLLSDVYVSDSGEILLLAKKSGITGALMSLAGLNTTLLYRLELVNASKNETYLRIAGKVSLSGNFIRFIDMDSEGDQNQFPRLISDSADGIFVTDTRNGGKTTTQSIIVKNVRFAEENNGQLYTVSVAPSESDVLTRDQRPYLVQFDEYENETRLKTIVLDNKNESGFPSAFKVYEGRVFWGYSNRPGLRVCSLSD